MSLSSTVTEAIVSLGKILNFFIRLTECTLETIVTGSNLDSYTYSKLWYALDFVLWSFQLVVSNKQRKREPVDLTMVIICHSLCQWIDLAYGPLSTILSIYK